MTPGARHLLDSDAAVAVPSAPALDHLGLFNLPAFHEATLAAGQERLQLDHYADDRLIGSLVGVVVDDEFTSGFSAPFGGLDLVRETESPPRIIDLVAAMCADLDGRGIRTIRLRARPPAYSQAEITVQFALLGAGFRIESVELNQHIDLAGLAAADYVERLGWRGRRDLRRSAAQGLLFREDIEPDHRAEAYGILRANREARGRPLRLSLDYLERLRAALPGRIRCFSLLAGDRACASAVIYLVRPGRWLLVYWGDASHALDQSPMNLLAFRLVEQALAEEIVLVDLGISSEQGRLNAGLAQFKESVGAVSSLRFELTRRVAP